MTDPYLPLRIFGIALSLICIPGLVWTMFQINRAKDE